MSLRGYVDSAAFAPHWPAADVDMHQVLEQLRHVDGLADRADLLLALHTHARERYAAGVLWWLASLSAPPQRPSRSARTPLRPDDPRSQPTTFRLATVRRQ